MKAIHTAFGDKKALAYLYKLTGETLKLEQTMQEIIALIKEFREWQKQPRKTTTKP